MLTLTAHVKNGRLLLDEPTALPEGEAVELVLYEEMHDRIRGELPSEAKLALGGSLRRWLEEARGDSLVQADVVLASLAGDP